MNSRLKEITERVEKAYKLDHRTPYSAGEDIPYLINHAESLLSQLKDENKMRCEWQARAETAETLVETQAKEIKRLDTLVMDLETREASVCPEDVGCDEYIPRLESKLSDAQEEIRRDISLAGLAEHCTVGDLVQAYLFEKRQLKAAVEAKIDAQERVKVLEKALQSICYLSQVALNGSQREYYEVNRADIARTANEALRVSQ